jgi:5-methylcytosine-specific restriction protein A
MSANQNTHWLRDELILVLDLYIREGVSPTQQTQGEMSDLLRKMPIDVELRARPKFRSAGAVAYKLANFASIDPSYQGTGMTHGSVLDNATWSEFHDKTEELAQAASNIRAFIEDGSMEPFEADIFDEEEIAEAAEGAIVTRSHQVRERDKKIVETKKKKALAGDALLRCEGCGFSFVETYGERGQGLIECHHTIPVSELKPGQKTKESDLALVCANCHRMIHRKRPWLTMAELKSLPN